MIFTFFNLCATEAPYTAKAIIEAENARKFSKARKLLEEAYWANDTQTFNDVFQALHFLEKRS